jgi:hypothetical protein
MVSLELVSGINQELVGIRQSPELLLVGERNLGKHKKRTYDYDVCLSFAGENRKYVREVAMSLKSRGVRVFFDEYAQVDMWGKDLYIHLDEIYRNTARYCILFASKHYAKKVWPTHERQSAQARAIRQHAEYILPAKFDDTDIPGLRPTIGYIDLRKTKPLKLTEIIIEKIGTRQAENYFPPNPDRLFKRLGAKTKKMQHIVEARANDFFKALTRMNKEERKSIFHIFMNGCPEELPENVHIELDLLRRITRFAPSKILRLLGSIESLGFRSFLREESEEECDSDVSIGHGQGKLVVLEWHDVSIDEDVFGCATEVANAIIKGAIEGYCEEHGMEHLNKLDFFTALNSNY